MAESQLPHSVKTWFESHLQSLPHARLLLIRQDGLPSPGNLPLFICKSDPAGGHLYQINLRRYEDILTLDIPGILAGYHLPGINPGTFPLYLVCTNGKRDACCAREGLPVYRALQKLVGSRTWQCTHVGGHRFAANILVLPEGLGYGRLAPADMPMLTAATAQNEILLEHFRGRSCYEPVVQAAEIHLYRRTSATQSGLFRFLQASLVDEDRWQVQFTGLEEGAVYQLTVQINRSTEQAFQSCKGDKQAPSLAFELADYRILPGLPGASGE